MAEKEIYDYVSTVTADVDQTISLSPQGVVAEAGGKAQVAHIADDESESRISFGDDASVFFVDLSWENITAADAGTLFDLWHDTAKANGIINSFKWLHPTDGHTYVVRFASTLPRNIKGSGAVHGVVNVRFKILGRIADA